MVVAGAKVILDFYNNDSLNEKKRQMQDLLKDVRKNFNVSATEVSDFDDLERCVIGLALCAGTEQGARAAIEKVLKHIDSTAFARVVFEDSEVMAFD